MSETQTETKKVEYNAVKAWLCVIAAFLFYMVGSGALNMLTPVLSLMLEEFGASTSFGATLSSIFSFSNAILAIPIGWVLNKWGFRKLSYAAYACLVVTSILGAFANSEIALVAIRFLQAIGYVVPGIVGVYVVTQWFPKDKQAFPITVVAIGPNLARMVVLQMSKWAIPLGGWRMQWWFFLVLCLIAFVFFVLFMKPGPNYAAVEAERLAKEQGKKGQEKAPLAQILTNKYVWCFTLIMFAFSCGSRGFDTFSNMIFTENCGVSNDTASDIGSFMSVGKILAAPICGLIMARFLNSSGKIVALCGTLCLVGMTIAFALTEEWQAWTVGGIIGFTTMAAPFCLAAFPKFIESPAVLAMGLSFYTCVGKYIASILAPYIVSFSKDFFGSFMFAAIPTGVFSLIGIVAWWYIGVQMDKKHKAEQAAA